MATWILEDDCLAPHEKIEFNYSGPNPFGVVKALTSDDFLRRTFEVDSSDIYERDFRWDITSDPRSFYIRLFLVKGLDSKSRIYYELIFQGAQPSDPKKKGKVSIRLRAKLRTEYPLVTAFQKTPIYKALLWIFNKLFYFKVRRNYLRICNDALKEFQREIRNIVKAPGE